MSDAVTEAERLFSVGEGVYFRSGTMGRKDLDELVLKAVEKYGAGPHLIIRVDIDPADKRQKLKFKGPISRGLGEEAPSPCMAEEKVWDLRYFSSTPRN